MSTPSEEPPFRRVLVANRGEIAIRVMRTLRDLGVESVAIHSDADRDALHVRHADEVRAIGGSTPAESYLRIDAVIDAAGAAGAEAVHPGYGFLAENADLARACAEAGLVWIGPPPEAIEAMGSKTRSRELMQAAGVPIVPGGTEPVETLAAARTAAEEIGWPIAVKARSGGGGRGFRVARAPEELEAAFAGASGEGERYFSDGAVYLERYLPDPRHVEVQLLADRHGGVVHLGERDCSVQRRHQKLVEECPGPHAGTAAGERLRERLGRIAIDAARAVGYVGAGTVECLLGSDGEPYFLEMNTRVQVEHTVTELVTGVDIVAEQVRIATGEPLRIVQEALRFDRYAIECRINAEDARDGFRPSSGTITTWTEPAGPWVRVDAGYRAGCVVSPHYDTLLAKVVAVGAGREEAIARMRRALDEMHVEGVATLVDFHRALLASEEFRAGGTCRTLVEDPVPMLDALAAVDATRRRPGLRVTREPRAVPRPEEHLVEVDGRRLVVAVHDPHTTRPAPPPVRPRVGGRAGGAGNVVAPIPGSVLSVAVREGQRVETGELLCVLEAMKMENEIAAPHAGVVTTVAVDAGDAVATGQILVVVDGDDGGDSGSEPSAEMTTDDARKPTASRG